MGVVASAEKTKDEMESMVHNTAVTTKLTREDDQKIREEFIEMADRLENWFRLTSAARYVSAEYWEKRSRWTAYITAAAVTITGASGGGLLSSTVSGNPRTRAVAFVTFSAGLVLTGVEAFDATQHNPERLSHEHQKAAAKLKTLRRRVVKWKRTRVPNYTIPLQQLDKEYEEILDERQRIELDSVPCEAWTQRAALDLLLEKDKVFRELVEDDDIN